MRDKYPDSSTRKGASIMTRTSLVITAVLAAVSATALPAATTCATSCTVEPVKIPYAKGVIETPVKAIIQMVKRQDERIRIASVPKATTVETATQTSSARPRTTGSVAMTAAAPQIELPAPISIAVRRFS